MERESEKKLDHPVILSFHFLAYTSREMCFLTIEDKYTIFLWTVNNYPQQFWDN